VHVLEKREIFSRVNILMLWQQTADDLIQYGARTFYPKFTNRNIGNAPLHLGTREIQLVYLKNALLLGVTFSYGTELVAVQAPGGEADSSWTAWTREATSTATHQTSAGVLDFKPNKTGDYTTGVGQGKCNQIQASEIDPTFALAADISKPDFIETYAFDALLLAEGEWSQTSKRLGISKSIDRFSQAIGMVLNLILDPSEPATKDPNMRSFTISLLDPIGRKLKEAGIAFEFGEYLKGETHYIVLTIKKSALLSHGALKEDLPGAALLTRDNLDEAALMVLARKVADIVGLPSTTQFTSFHPAKLFDFSTRARCLNGFGVLGVVDGGAAQGQIISIDLEAQPYLAAEETKYFARALTDAEAELVKREEERIELEEAIKQVTSKLKETLEGVADDMIAKSSYSSEHQAKEQRSMSGGEVLDSEWDDEEDLAAKVEAAKAEQAALKHKGQSASDEREYTEEEEKELMEAQLEAYKRSLAQLAEKTRVNQGQADAAKIKKEEWAERLKTAARGYAKAVPVLPIGDTLLEPFWPQGLGSNRGFHSALDAIWTVHLCQESGLAAALLERNFWYDLMLQGPWTNALLKPAKTWSADPLSRYVDGAIVRTKHNYSNPASKRLFKGEGATPERISALGLKNTGGWK